MMPPHDVRQLPLQRLGKVLWHFPLLESTNSLALVLAQDRAHDGLVLLADAQTAGRGQYGRSWTAPPGSSVLLSVLVFPPVHVRQTALLTAWAAVAVCATVQDVSGLPARIKWPNDVLVHDKKVCGILIEQRNTGKADLPLAAAVGIGLNVSQPAAFFAAADLPHAGSLLSLSGATFDTWQVAKTLLGHLDRAYDQLLAGDAATLEELWKRRLGLLGKQVRLELAHEHKEGRLLDVSWDGVILEEPEQIVQITPELVRHIVPV